MEFGEEGLVFLSKIFLGVCEGGDEKEYDEGHDMNKFMGKAVRFSRFAQIF